jgi:hypothetical protein
MKRKILVGDNILFESSTGRRKGTIIDMVIYPEIGPVFDVVTDKGEEVIKESNVIRKIKNRTV